MEEITSITTYNTDTYNSWGIGHKTKPISVDFEKVLKYAIEIKANLIVKPSRGKNWYIKGINNKKSYDEIKIHLENNKKSNYKPKSRTWLISYRT